MRGYIPPQNSEENIFVKKIVRILELAQGIGNVQYTLFMDMRQQQLFLAQANKYPDINIRMVCGYDGEGERMLAVVYPDFVDFDSLPLPLVILRTKLTDNNISHKDFLGAAMSLKIERNFSSENAKCRSYTGFPSVPCNMFSIFCIFASSESSNMAIT